MKAAPRGFVTVRPEPAFRADAFAAGLEANGYRVSRHMPMRGELAADSVVVVWNETTSSLAAREAATAVGATIIVAENGYVGSKGDAPVYAIALDHHNGAGRWPGQCAGGLAPTFPIRRDAAVRMPKLGLDYRAWRQPAKKGHILVLPQRGIGAKGVAMPRDWLNKTLGALRRGSARPIRVRHHPGTSNVPPLAGDLAGAHCAVTWGSGAGVKALVAGIPVFSDFPRWIAAAAARPLDHDLEDPWLGNRVPVLESIAWAQWAVPEIQSGEPFRHLLELAAQDRAEKQASA